MAEKIIKTVEEEIAKTKVSSKEVKVARKVPVSKISKQEQVETVILSEKKNTSVQKKTEKKEGSLHVAVYDVNGKEVDTLILPQEMFGAKINKSLMAQAVRVYLANQRQGNASTKT